MPGSMDGRICLLTGATSGIGRVAAEAIAREGATLVLVGRDRQKTERAANQIRTETGNRHISYLLADLSSLAQVRGLAEEFRSRHQSLHVLVNNAGAMFSGRHETADGFEMTFALNHLSYFLLTHELLDLLTASAPARIVNVASNAHTRGTINFDDLQSVQRFNPMTAYSQSKLANILFTYELSRRLIGTGVTANCLHPGFVRTGFGKNDAWWMKLAVSLAMCVARTPQKGAQGLIYLATAAEVESISGKYYVDYRARSSSRESHDSEIQRRLWETSEKLVSASEQVSGGEVAGSLSHTPV